MISSDTIIYNHPWIVPSKSKIYSFGDAMPLSPYEIAYQDVQSFSDPSSTKTDLMNVVHDESLSTSNSNPITFSKPVHTDEKICEILCVDDLQWEYIHHKSSFLLEIDRFENDFSSIFSTDYVKEPQNPMQNPDSKLNLGNISRTFPIDIEKVHIGASCMKDEIQTYTALFQEFRDVFSWSYEQMPGIDPAIVVHEIKTSRMLNPSGNICIKSTREKLLPLKQKLKNYSKQGSYIQFR